MIRTLLIKKKYYDLIKSGIKNVEYRAHNKYYKKLFKNKVNYIKFHYQGKCHIYAEVFRLELIKTPKSIKIQAKNEGIKIGNKIYRILLGKIIKKGDIKNEIR
jgi:hypothetical protein